MADGVLQRTHHAVRVLGLDLAVQLAIGQLPYRPGDLVGLGAQGRAQVADESQRHAHTQYHCQAGHHKDQHPESAGYLTHLADVACDGCFLIFDKGIDALEPFAIAARYFRQQQRPGAVQIIVQPQAQQFFTACQGRAFDTLYILKQAQFIPAGGGLGEQGIHGAG